MVACSNLGIDIIALPMTIILWYVATGIVSTSVQISPLYVLQNNVSGGLSLFLKVVIAY